MTGDTSTDQDLRSYAQVSTYLGRPRRRTRLYSTWLESETDECGASLIVPWRGVMSFPSEWTSDYYDALMRRALGLVSEAEANPGEWMYMGSPFETRVRYLPDDPTPEGIGGWEIKTRDDPNGREWEYKRVPAEVAAKQLVKGVTEGIWQGGYSGSEFGRFMDRLRMEVEMAGRRFPRAD